ncbi:MAG: DUF2157 domain-containing protein [Xanthomonadales bacterium]|jgi:uncharacterized membrane protein|nr:DUF2157 domain-containing protein [Xanthomonadales bacterium]
MSRLSRPALDALARAAGLDASRCAALLDAAGARPDAGEWRAALQRFAAVAGVLALGFGAVFFIAANWSALTPNGRLGLLQLLFVAAVAAALWRPPPDPVGRGALLLAFIGAGALFALFGQTFQTGADLHELFALWALLGLPLVLAARWAAASAAWLLVANLALALFCGLMPAAHPLWLLFGFSDTDGTLRLLFAMAPNLLLWALAEWRAVRDPRLAAWLPRWLRRLLLLTGLGYGTVAAFIAIVDAESGRVATVSIFLLSAALVGVYCVQVRREALGLVALAASGILLGLAVLIEILQGSDAQLLLYPLWVLGASALAGTLLLPLVRRWEGEAHAD